MDNPERVFYGQIKYSGLTKGSVPWKSGHLAFVKDDNGWKMDFVYTVTKNGRPALTVRINKNSVRKCSCNNKVICLDMKLDDKSAVLITYQGESRQLHDLVTSILKEGEGEPVCKAEVSKIKEETSPKFTSVKEVKRDRYIEESKENRW